MKKYFPLFVFLFISLFSFSQTVIQEGEVSGLWSKSQSPFLVEGNINIPLDSTLIIEPGVEVIFQGQFMFDISGSLRAIGLEEDSILFTTNDTIGFAQLDNYDIGWRGINFLSDFYPVDTSIIKYSIIEYVCPSADILNNPSQGSIRIQGDARGPVYIENSWIRNNRVCIISEWGKLYLFNNIISNNSGGGLYYIYDSGITYGNIISENTANVDFHYKVGGVFSNYSTGFINNTVCFNEAVSGGGIQVSNDGGLLEVYNCILYGNDATSGNGTMAYANTMLINFHNCVLDGTLVESPGETSEFFTDFDDIFSDASSVIYTLSPNSVAIDSGINEIYIGSELFEHPEFDVLGSPRIAGSQIDVGAIETSITHSINDEDKLQISIYPNPAQESIILDFSSFNSASVNLRIFDMKGRLVLEESYNNTQTIIDISSLRRGGYIVSIESDGKRVNQFLIKD